MELPRYGWRKKASEAVQEPRNQHLSPDIGQIKHLLPLGARYVFRHVLRKRISGRKPPIDQIRMLNGSGLNGVHCGGIGSGTIGRGFKGEFR